MASRGSARNDPSRRDLGRQLQGAVLLAAVAACVGAVILVTYPVLLKGLSVDDQATGGPHRWLSVLGISCVAVMLGALVWVVRVAARMTDSATGNALVHRDRPVEGAVPLVPEETVEQRSALPERALAVSRAMVGALDLNVLTQRVLHAVSDAFEPACVGLFLVDSSADMLVLQAGLCENGEAIPPQDHSVGLDHERLAKSLADFSVSVSVETVESLLLHPDLEFPDSRAEAIVPMRHQGRALGALVLQDRDSDAFDAATLATLQDVADQLGAAVEAALDHESVQIALASARKSLGQASREALLGALPEGVMGYERLSNGGVGPVRGAWDKDIARVAALGEVERKGRTLMIPIRMQDTVVGVVRLQKPDAGPEWSDHEVGLARTVVAHLGVALERVRLRNALASTTASARVLREGTERLRAAHDWDSLMQAAVQEIGQAVQASRVFVQWLPSGPGKTGNSADEVPGARTDEP